MTEHGVLLGSCAALNAVPEIAPRRDPLEVLRTVWGYPAFRGLQEEVIGHVLAATTRWC